MSGLRCPQTHLVEALHDGRLGTAAAGSVQRHLTGCAACRDWLRDLEAIRGTLLAGADQPSRLQHQRARAALLRAAASPPRRRAVGRPFWLVLAGVGAAATAMAGSGAWRALWKPVPEREPPPAVVRDQPPRTQAPAPKNTASTARSAMHRPNGTVEQAPPEDPTPPEPTPAEPGATEPAGRRAPSAPTVQLAPPIGTYRGKPPRAASVSVRPESATAPATEPGPPPPQPRASGAPTPVPAAPAPAPSAPTPASRDFASAMQALGAGDFGSAARQFTAFLSAHPRDPRAEEVAYLIAIAHERAGRSEQARAAARRYLAAWPDGAYRRRAAKIVAIPGNE